MLFDFVRAGSPPPRTDRHRLAGIAYIDGVPGRQLVTLIDRLTITLVAAKMSAPVTGVFEFSGLPQYDLRRLCVVGFDIAGDYNAEPADYLTQVTG